jgi:tetratricopeptide (TPR) repeat protein
MTNIAMVDRLSKSLVGLVALFVAASFAPGFVSVAHAQEKKANDDETAKQVLQVIREGNEAFDSENYEAAFEKYEQAYELYPDPAILVRLGKTAEKLGKNEQAIGYYREFARLMPDDPAAKKLSLKADDLEAALPVVVAVQSEPAGADIFVDSPVGDAVGTTPADIELPKGVHTIYLKREGFETTSKEIKVEDKEGQSVSATLARAMVTQDDDTSVEPLQRDTSTISTIGWASLGVGAASLATSGVFLILKNGAEDDVNDYDKRAPGASRAELDELKDDANSYYDTALVTGIAGGVFAATGAGLLTYHYLTADQDEDDVAVNVGAGFDAEGAWFGVNGRF